MTRDDSGRSPPSGSVPLMAPVAATHSSTEPAVMSQLIQQLLRQEQQAAQYMANALHDRLGQALAATRMHLDLIRPGPGAPSADELPGEIDRIEALLDQAIKGVRQLLSELRPPLLAAHGLVKALEHEIQRRDEEGNAVDVLLETDDAVRELRWPAEVEYGVFMIAREAIDNALRHANASLIRVLLDGGVGNLHLEVIDDGADALSAHRSVSAAQLGVAAMRERAQMMRADFAVAPADGSGTRVALSWKAGTP